MLSDRVSAELASYVAALHRRFGADLVSVVAFGSRVRGDRYEGLRNVAREVSDEFADMVAPILLTPEEASHVKRYYLGMLSGHMIVSDEGQFFAGVLDRLRQRLAELGSRRYVDDQGYEYWDLKPDWKPGDIVTL
jgi:hypothetical protein